MSEYTLGKPEDLAWELLASGEECLVVGDGALRYPSVFAEAARTDFGDLGDAYPSAAALVEGGADAIIIETQTSLEELLIGIQAAQTAGSKCIIGSMAYDVTLDGSTFRTPRIGVTTHKGVNMDKAGVEPDVPAVVHPDQLARGQDAQIERAVAVLLEDVVAWRKARPPVAGNPSVGNPGTGAAPAP